VIFYKDNTKYAYGLTLTVKDVLEEYLYFFENDKQRTIFERSNIADYIFNDEYGINPDYQILDYFRQFTANNKPYLSIMVTLNYTKAMGVYNWVSDMYLYTNGAPYNILRTRYFEANADQEKIDRIDSIVKKAVDWVKAMDAGIADIQIKEDKDLFKDDYFYNGKYTWDNYVKMFNNIISIHEIDKGDGTRSKFDFKFYSNESDGTHVFFSIALAIAEKISRGGVFLKDELSGGLHTLLSKYIIRIFSSVENTLNSQIIITTHDTNLLDLDLFRRDQIWFVEKNADTGSTILYSLCDFEISEDKKNESTDIEKGYLLGIYGAIPFIEAM